MELVWLQFPCDFILTKKLRKVAPSTKKRAHHLPIILIKYRVKSHHYFNNKVHKSIAPPIMKTITFNLLKTAYRTPVFYR